LFHFSTSPRGFIAPLRQMQISLEPEEGLPMNIHHVEQPSPITQLAGRTPNFQNLCGHDWYWLLLL
jgi:hypothetical protein